MNTYNRAKEIQNVRTQLLPFGELRRGFSFNAFNCMKAYSYNGERYGYYGYDASGERTYKYDMYSAGSWTNQTGGMDVSLQIDKMMLYPNGYLNMNQNGEYTKHYYADALRIASKIGSGFSQDLCYEANQIGNEVDPGYLDQRMYKQYEEMKEELSELIDGNQVMDILPTSYPDANLCNLSGSGIETALFFYHPDHLGSTGMVTNNSSNFTQGMLYAPFGEIISDYNPTFHDSPMPNYAFNAKELDEENNMYYYSARYYAPPTFISRDPMFEKYPSISPYTYCKNSPLNFVDPTGETLYVYSTKGKILFSLDDGREGYSIISAKELYNRGIQWFEPTANNYMPLIKVMPYTKTSDELKHFTWEEIVDFAEKDRPMFFYFKGMPGDWKSRKKGADGYFLVTVDGMPYWADAIGQIPFAIDCFTDFLYIYGDYSIAAEKTIKRGQIMGDGKPFGKSDYSNSYDNAMIRRAIKWASQRYKIIYNNSREVIFVKTKHSPKEIQRSSDN